jgi:hypothetical protein
MKKDDRNTIINLITSLIDLKEDDKIVDFQISWNVEDSVLDIHVIPKQSAKYIETKFTVLPTGAVFN